ncbi:MAG: 50S ribosomal protein L11 methyltransferase [Anaerovoracaceae bacterium]
MNYIKYTIYTSRQGIELVTGMLMEQGITQTVVEDPADVEEMLEKKNDYDWDFIDEKVMEKQNQEPTVSVYIEDSPKGREQLGQLKIALMMLKSKEMEGDFGWDANLGRLYGEDTLVKEDWKDNWKKYFKPSKVTDKLVVKPTWEDYEPSGEEMIITLDPGMAFGTGTHETTSMCLELMEKAGVSKKSVLDLGCGSGILSIGAALLGSCQVLAIDIDPNAVKVARENVRQNQGSEKITVMEGDLTKGIDFKADIVVANLMADLVVTLSADVANYLKPEGIYISSGILITQKSDVVTAFEKGGFKVLKVIEKGEWCAILATVR